ncbi:hypothetical protein [uncultured Jatrophihabitans sp.]|uniref:hypothetical protein n=1 Tax=uncultured Jatrophihabitans sp. TaxID=1610747 RepID=UPI0035CB5C26
MTTTTASATPIRDDRALRTTGALALLSGGALVVDTVTTAAINRHFDPLDSILFLTGFAGLWLTAIALAVVLSSARQGSARVLAALGIFLATGLILAAVSAAFDQLGRHLFSRSNIGLHGEWSFFSIGVCMLFIAAWAIRSHRSTGGPHD